MASACSRFLRGCSKFSGIYPHHRECRGNTHLLTPRAGFDRVCSPHFSSRACSPDSNLRFSQGFNNLDMGSQGCPLSQAMGRSQPPQLGAMIATQAITGLAGSKGGAMSRWHTVARRSSEVVGSPG